MLLLYCTLTKNVIVGQLSRFKNYMHIVKDLSSGVSILVIATLPLASYLFIYCCPMEYNSTTEQGRQYL